MPRVFPREDFLSSKRLIVFYRARPNDSPEVILRRDIGPGGRAAFPVARTARNGLGTLPFEGRRTGPRPVL